MRTPRLALLVTAGALALTACGGDDTASSPGTAGSNDLAPPSAAAEPSSPASGAPSGAAPAAGTAGRPAPDTCTALPEAADGRYAVADAGTVVVTRDGDRLVLGEVTPAEGWTAEEVDTEDDEVEVEFRNGPDELDLEVEVEDGGRLSVEVCADDD